MEDVHRLCGLPYNVSYTAWDSTHHTFPSCFMWTAISYPCHGILTAVCAYCFGTTSNARTHHVVTTATSVLVMMINILMLGMGVTSLVELLLSYILAESHPPAYVLAKTLSFTAWLFCFAVQMRRRALTRGGNKVYLLGAVLVVGVSSAIQLQFVVQHMLVPSGKKRHVNPQHVGMIVYFFLNVFLLVVVLMYLLKSKRATYNRGIPTLSRTASSIQTSGDEFGDTRSLLSSSGSNVAFSSDQKDQAEGIDLGKAENANWFSRLFFLWCKPLMVKGYQSQLLEPDDLFILPDNLNTSTIKETMSSLLQMQKHRSVMRELKTDIINDCQYAPTPREVHVSLVRSLFQAFGKFYFSLGIVKFLNDCFGFAGPVLLNLLVKFIENKQEPMKDGYYYALGLFSTTLLSVLFSLQYRYYVQKVTLQVRAGLITTIYDKTLAVSSSGISTRLSRGQVLNLMSTDTDRVSNFCNSFHEFWSMPFQIAVVLYLLYQQVGLAFLTGVTFIVLLIPLNKLIANKIGDVNRNLMKQKDGRVELMNEILNGIRVIKMYAWEQCFSGKVDAVRRLELKSLKFVKYLDAMCVYLWASTPVLISVLTFVTYVSLGNQLSAAKVFTSIALFNMLIGPLNAFPWVINGLMEAKISLHRMESFLSLAEVNLEEFYVKMTSEDDKNVMALEIEESQFRWQGRTWKDDKKPETVVDESSVQSESLPAEKSANEPGSSVNSKSFSADHQDGEGKRFQLNDINLYARKGHFIGITGKVGSGKSSLFSAITAEMEKESGYVYVTEDFAGFGYVTQEPWIQHMTIQDNILFGCPYDRERYEQVLYACALTDDLGIFPAKDLTEVGENGVNLSGGQKARISLARAVYQDKEVYLIDDPIAAVDAHVASHIFRYCILGLLREKTVILCTHHKKYLEQADSVILMRDGAIVSSGPPADILLKAEVEMLIEEETEDECVEELPGATVMSVDSLNLDRMSISQHNGGLVEEEHREKGTVSLHVYVTYWKSAGTVLAVLVFVFLFFMQASRNVSDWWLAYWISHSQMHSNATAYYSIDNDHLSTLRRVASLHDYLLIYGCIGIGNSVFTFFRSFLFAYGGVVAATKLHDKLLASMLAAPISFFDVTPIGRIINRFSSDTSTVDDGLPFIMNILFAQFFGVLGTVVITCYGIPWFTIALVPLGAIYFYTQNYYRMTSRELKRLSSVTLSPVYEHFSETLSGLMTIRAFQESKRFINENEKKLDSSQRANYSGVVAEMWLLLRLSMIGVTMVTAVSFLAVFEHHFNSVNPGLVGLAISYALSITWKLSGLVRAFVDTEKQMICVERVLEYIDGAPQEEEGSAMLDFHWPYTGNIIFSSVSLRYRTGLPLALDAVSFNVKGGEKIGICGRTGSGKSSLFRVLFKTVPLTSGDVWIDGVNTGNVNVSQLRTQLAIIPQDPFLFDDSLAANLDPHHTSTSFEMTDILHKCHLGNLLDELGGGLEGKVGERGKFLSCGQKQLLCLGRALLKKCNVICIDEATASVDLETDRLIQTTIRKEFAASTVLTIAHRMDTIMDYDRVLVMDGGRVAEFDCPERLLKNESSIFFKLVQENAATFNK